MPLNRKRKKSDDKTGIDLTPVLSIVFIVLLFFIVAVPLMQERGFDFTGGDGCEFQIVIAVDSQNRIFIEDEGRLKQVDIRAVRASVARKLGESLSCRVLVQADRRSDMGTVIRVVDQAKLAHDPPPDVDIATVDYTRDLSATPPNP